MTMSRHEPPKQSFPSFRIPERSLSLNSYNSNEKCFVSIPPQYSSRLFSFRKSSLS